MTPKPTIPEVLPLDQPPREDDATYYHATPEQVEQYYNRLQAALDKAKDAPALLPWYQGEPEQIEDPQSEEGNQ